MPASRAASATPMASAEYVIVIAVTRSASDSAKAATWDRW
jgi:hypothetical protein